MVGQVEKLDVAALVGEMADFQFSREIPPEAAFLEEALRYLFCFLLAGCCNYHDNARVLQVLHRQHIKRYNELEFSLLKKFC